MPQTGKMRSNVSSKSKPIQKSHAASGSDGTTGDSMRDRVRALFGDALFVAEEGVVETKQDAMAKAVQLETTMFNRYRGVNAEYKDKFRTLKFNLKDPKNPNLRRRVLEDEIKPNSLLEMSSTELANHEEQERKKQLETKAMREAQQGQVEASTDQFKCGKCKQRKTTYYQMQTRSADEPMTTFVQCVNCGNRWKC